MDKANRYANLLMPDQRQYRMDQLRLVAIIGAVLASTSWRALPSVPVVTLWD